MLSFVAAEQKQGQKEGKVTVETFLWLYVATPEISANSPLSLPVVHESTIKFFLQSTNQDKSSQTVGGDS